MCVQTDFSKPSFARYLKALALMANGVQPVEPNPDFMVELKKAAGNKAVCLMCETGGRWAFAQRATMLPFCN